jgi:uncharacterized membrane protein
LSIGTFGLGKGRLEALTDGIFATVMTVLVLSLSIPSILSPGALGPYINGLGPIVLSYILSFLILGVFWVRHHALFHFLTRVDSTFIWLNISFLLTIGFIPFSTELLGRFPLDEVSTVIYGVNLIATALTMQLLWFYSTRRELVAVSLDEEVLARINRRLLLGPGLYLIAIAFGFLSTDISFGIYVISLAYYVIASSTGRGALGTSFRKLFRAQQRHGSSAPP